MGEVFKVDTSLGEAPKPKDLPADQANKLAEQAKSGVTRAVAESTPKAPERPAWLPEKFKSPEDMAKAYSELEKKQGSQVAPKPTETPAPKPDEKKPADTSKTIDSLKLEEGKATDDKTAEAAVAKAGLDMAKLNTEFQQKGELSPESLKALEGVGITKDVVELYIEGQKALVAQRVSDIESVAGGREQFDQMRAWGATNLSDAEKQTINKAVASNDHQAIKMAYQAVHSKWMAAGQAEPQQIRGERGTPTGDVYTHRDEIKADMKKPEYKTNEAFRQKVMDKVARSNVW